MQLTRLSWQHHSNSMEVTIGYCGVSGFGGMGIVERWNSGMVEWIFFSILFACLSTNYYSMA